MALEQGAKHFKHGAIANEVAAEIGEQLMLRTEEALPRLHGKATIVHRPRVSGDDGAAP